MNGADQGGVNEKQNVAIAWQIAFLVALLGVLALPLISDFDSILETDGGEIGPFLIFAAVVLGLAVGGRYSPTLSGAAAGVTVLVSIVLSLLITFGFILTELLSEFDSGIQWGGGAWATVAATVVGIVATVTSGRAWNPEIGRQMTPVALAGAGAVSVMVLGLVIPEDDLTVGDTLGFSAHPLIGLGFTLFLGGIAAVGIAGFLLGRWGLGLLFGFLGYILLGWMTSSSDDQSTTFGWSGVDSSSDFHTLTVIGFWVAAALFGVHAVQQFGTSPGSGRSGAATPRPVGASPPPPMSGEWAPDPFGRHRLRYFYGNEWTDHVSDGGMQGRDKPVLRAPLDRRPQWAPDPLGRHRQRYWNGREWTAHVADQGQQGIDEPLADPLGPTAGPGPLPSSAGGAVPTGDETMSRPPRLDTGAPDTPLPSNPSSQILPPGPVSAGAPAPKALPPNAPAWSDGDHDGLTRPYTPSGGAKFLVEFSAGGAFEFDGTVVVGREPSVPDEYPRAIIHQVPDLTVSKTHVAVGVDGDEAWVADLHSSNGTTVERDGQTVPLVPGQPFRLRSHESVVIGDTTSFTIYTSRAG